MNENVNKQDDFNNFYTVVYSNVDSYLNKRDEFLMRLDVLKPDIIALTEIKANNQKFFNESEYALDNYDTFINKNHKLGTVLHTDKSLKAQEVSILNDNEFEESVWCTFTTHNAEKVLLGCIYRSPNSSPTNTENLKSLLSSQLIQTYDKICIVGDFNLPSIRWDGEWTNEEDDSFIECIRDAYLFQQVQKPTRARHGQTSNILDLVLVNDQDLTSEIEHLDPLGKSDHHVLKFQLQIQKSKIKYTPKYSYNLKKGDYRKMREEFQDQNWQDMHNMALEEAWEHIKTLIHSSMDKHIPKKKCTAKRNIKPPWMTQSIGKQAKRKYYLYQKYMQSKSGHDYDKYIKMRNLCKKKIKKARKNHERDIANKSKDNPSCFWKYVQARTKSDAGICTLNREDGSKAATDQDKAETLNKFFASVFTREDVSSVPPLEEGSRSQGIFISEARVTPTAVEDRLKKLNTKKAQGPDKVPARVLSELSKELAVPLSIIFNMSLESGTLPKDWKEAEVTAIFKKGSKSDPGNYRPVSLTCILCKVLESVVRDAVVTHFEDHKLYAECQHGFRRKRSCVSQLLEVMEDLTAIMEAGDSLDIVYLDFRKAFDSVPHERLLTKLAAYGVSGNLLKWIRHFLSDRTQKVRIGDSLSSEAKVISGIPQGSILGPILFTVFINDLPDSIDSTCKIFADDTKLYGSVKNQAEIQKDLTSLQNWSDTWNLHFNVAKCKVLHVGKNNPEHNYSMTLNGRGQSVGKCTEEKDLGVTFDKAFTFDVHIQRAINKANQMIGLIKRTFISPDKDTFVKLYKALVRPHLEYGNIIWHPTLKRQSAAIEKSQKRATRLVRQCKGMSYPERLRFLKLHSLKGRRLRGDLIETFKIFNGLVDIKPDSIFPPCQYSHTRNADKKIFVQHSNTKYKRNSLANRVAKYWNKLPDHVKNAKSTNAFKNHLDSHPKFIRIFREYD